jgi:hypothetical protein
MPNELEERAREHWSRQSIAGIVIQAITESREGKGMALPAGRAADQILALLASSLAFTQEAGWMPSSDDAELVELLTDWRDYFAPNGKRIRLADGNKERLHMILGRVIDRLSPDPHTMDRAGTAQEVDDA